MAIDHKQAAQGFLRMVVGGKVKQAYETYVAPGFKHHNAYFAGDAESLMKGMEDDNERNPNKELAVVHTMEDGDLVAVHSRLRKPGDHQDIAVVHIFRFDDDRIIELWDIAQVGPERSPNLNGMF